MTIFEPSQSSTPSVAESQITEQDAAISGAISILEQQLAQLNAHILAIGQQFSETVSEAGAENADAHQVLTELRAAASEVQSTIAKVKTGGRSVPAAALSQLSGRIANILNDVTEESSNLAELGSRTRHRTVTTHPKNDPQKTPIPTVNAGVLNGLGNQSSRHTNKNNGEFLPPMDPNDRRNNDGVVSHREVVGGLIGTARALGNKKKLATAQRIEEEILDAAKRDDRRGMLDGALHAGRGAARVTGSEDIGHAVTVGVGTAVTKSNTAENLIRKGRVDDIASATIRNVNGGISVIGDWTGLSAMTNAIGIRSLTRAQLNPHMDALMNDSQYDWEHLVNARHIKQFDTDGNDRIDAGEILGVLRNNGVTFNRVDTDNNGNISFQELRVQLIAIAKRNKVMVEGHAVAATPAPRPVPTATATPAPTATRDNYRIS